MTGWGAHETSEPCGDTLFRKKEKLDARASCLGSRVVVLGSWEGSGGAGWEGMWGCFVGGSNARLKAWSSLDNGHQWVSKSKKHTLPVFMQKLSFCKGES